MISSVLFEREFLKSPRHDRRNFAFSTLVPDLHLQAARVLRGAASGHAKTSVARGKRHRAGIEHIVDLRAGADPRDGQPLVKLGKARLQKQRPPQRDAALLRLGGQRPVSVQPPEHQFGMCLDDAPLQAGRHHRIDLHDLRPQVPKLGRHHLFPKRFQRVIGRGLRAVRPHPAARAGEHPRGMRPQQRAGRKIAGPIARLRQADRDIDRGAVERPRQQFGDVVKKRNRAPPARDLDRDPSVPKAIETEDNSHQAL